MPGNIVERLILNVPTGHVKDNQGIRRSHYVFMKGRSCLTNLISIYEQGTHLVEEGKAADVVYLNFHRITESQNGRGWKGPLWVI